MPNNDKKQEIQKKDEKKKDFKIHTVYSNTQFCIPIHI